MLDVPTTLETGVANENNNFYNSENQMDYGISDNADQLVSFQNAFDAKGGDCTTYGREDDKADNVPCAHILPELWNAGQILVSIVGLEWNAMLLYIMIC